jgi:hypothetical protein
MLEPKKLCKRNVLQWVVHSAMIVGVAGGGRGFSSGFFGFRTDTVAVLPSYLHMYIYVYWS